MTYSKITPSFFAALVGILLLAGCQTGGHEMDHGAKAVEVHQAWARASAKMARAGGAFMHITNPTAMDDKLVAAHADISKTVELHTHIMEGKMMKMRQVPFIDVPAGKGAMLKPGGLHVMFLGLHKPLVKGETFPLTLEFEKAGKIKVEVMVKGVAAGAMPMKGGHDGHMMKH